MNAIAQPFEQRPMPGWDVIIEKGGYVLHLPTLRVGRVEKFFNAGNYYPMEDGVVQPPVMEPVVQLSSGDSFVASPSHFLYLSEHEAKFYEVMEQTLIEMLKQMGAILVEMKVPPKLGVTLVATALRRQALAIAGPPPEMA